MHAGVAERPRVQHHALVDVGRSLEDGLERIVQLGQGDLGEEAQAAEVDAEDGHRGSGLRDAARHADERAVAAEHDHEVARLRHVVA